MRGNRRVGSVGPGDQSVTSVRSTTDRVVWDSEFTATRDAAEYSGSGALASGLYQWSG